MITADGLVICEWDVTAHFPANDHRPGEFETLSGCLAIRCDKHERSTRGNSSVRGWCSGPRYWGWKCIQTGQGWERRCTVSRALCLWHGIRVFGERDAGFRQHPDNRKALVLRIAEACVAKRDGNQNTNPPG
jgi:hypothetical protein